MRSFCALSNLDVIIRSVVMAIAVTIGAPVMAFPISIMWRAMRGANGSAVLPRDHAAAVVHYLVKVYAWKLILAKEGIISWMAEQTHLTWLLDGILAIP